MAGADASITTGDLRCFGFHFDGREEKYRWAMEAVCCSTVELTAAGRWFIWMNYFVHSIMYAYYSIVSTGIRLPKRLSMTVTALQTTQMLIGVMISVYVLFLKLNGAVSSCGSCF
ncbi:unnamed protein product [Heligmosomoides polygyrus]|uniref:Elongation of very long chain fatty acids protein n=1 Tax=Heligmosomoides polygyrus TaxID=6339 RepID=A0A183FK21_HELPZ|nr:unnamed protein product [Heligmosomoides polygyrus]